MGLFCQLCGQLWYLCVRCDANGTLTHLDMGRASLVSVNVVVWQAALVACRYSHIQLDAQHAGCHSSCPDKPPEVCLSASMKSHFACMCPWASLVFRALVCQTTHKGMWTSCCWWEPCQMTTLYTSGSAQIVHAFCMPVFWTEPNHSASAAPVTALKLHAAQVCLPACSGNYQLETW